MRARRRQVHKQWKLRRSSRKRRRRKHRREKTNKKSGEGRYIKCYREV